MYIHKFLSKSQTLAVCCVLGVTYAGFKGLISTGLLQKLTARALELMQELHGTALYCTPKILHPSELWECLGLSHKDHVEALENPFIPAKSADDYFDDQHSLNPYNDVTP